MASRSVRLLRLAFPAAVVLLAAALRLWHLGSLPPGLQFDEAHNAIDAGGVLDGVRLLFFPDNGGREPLVTYLHAPALALLGRDNPVMALRFVSALVGIATVCVLYGFARRFFRDRLTGALAAAFLATSYWHLHFSRYGIRAVLAPLWTTLTIWAWWRAVGAADTRGAARAHEPRPSPASRTTSPVHRALASHTAAAMASGVFMAAAVYSHPSGRLLPLILIAHALFRTVGQRRESLRATWQPLLITGATALALFVPLGLDFASHPEHFFGHPSDVSLAAIAESQYGGSLVRAAAANVRAVAGMFFIAGDPSTFHNLPGLPVFDPLTALLAVVGSGLLLAAILSRRSAQRDRAVLLTAWLGVMLIPTLLSDRPPNYSRAIAALPVIVILPALGTRWLLDQARGVPRRARQGLVVLLIAAATFWTSWHYFHTFAQTPHVYYSYDVEKKDAYDQLVAISADANVFLHPLWAQHASIAYMNRNGPVRTLDGRDTVALLADGRDSVIAFPAKEEQREGWDELVADLYGGVAEHRIIRDAQGKPALSTYRIARGDLDRLPGQHPPPATANGVVFGNAIRLAGYDVGPLRAGEPASVTLRWLSEAEVDDDLTVFVHLLDSDGKSVGQMDREPGWASFRTSDWEPGDVVIDRYRPLLAADAEGPVTVVVGWYDQASGKRLRVGNVDALEIGRFQIETEGDG